MELTDNDWQIIEVLLPESRRVNVADLGVATERCLMRSFGYSAQVRRGGTYPRSIHHIKPATVAFRNGLLMGR